MADTTPAPADGGVKNPGKPDEVKYKADVAEADKKLNAAKEKFVSWPTSSLGYLLIRTRKLL
jgi:hypothetical protein